MNLIQFQFRSNVGPLVGPFHCLPRVCDRPVMMTGMLAGPVHRQRLARSIRCAPVLAVSLR